jgi:hypothetical protein
LSTIVIATLMPPLPGTCQPIAKQNQRERQEGMTGILPEALTYEVFIKRDGG